MEDPPEGKGCSQQNRGAPGCCRVPGPVLGSLAAGQPPLGIMDPVDPRPQLQTSLSERGQGGVQGPPSITRAQRGRAGANQLPMFPPVSSPAPPGLAPKFGVGVGSFPPPSSPQAPLTQVIATAYTQAPCLYPTSTPLPGWPIHIQIHQHGPFWNSLSAPAPQHHEMKPLLLLGGCTAA